MKRFNDTDMELAIKQRLEEGAEQGLDNQKTFTDFKLCDEILDKIPLLTDILVITNLEFVYTLYRRGINPKEISYVSPDPLKRKFAEQLFGVNTYSYNKEIKEGDVMGRKFKVVVTNPPYQARKTNTDANLWVRFADASMNIIKNGGYLGLITPPTWMGKNKQTKKMDYSIYSKYQIRHVEMFDSIQQKKHFPGVGSKICWYIIRKVKPTTTTKIVQWINNTRYTFNHTIKFNDKLYPTVMTPITVSLDEKLKAVDPFIVHKTCECHGSKLKKAGSVSDIPTKEFTNPVFYSHQITRYTNVKGTFFNIKKVIIPSTGTIANSFYNKQGNVNEDIRFIIVKTEQEGQELEQLLTNTKLYLYIGTAYRPGRNLRVENLSLPLVDLTRSWTDEELYDHFNLTTEEIKLIEDTIK